MIELAWIVKSVLGAAIIGLIAAIGWQWRLVLTTRDRIAALEGCSETVEVRQMLVARIDALDRELSALRLRMAEHYISREDWVPMTSRVIGLLEQHTAMLARLDERSQRQHGGSP